MIDEEVIEVLYNGCHGGWKISENAIELYKLRNKNYNFIGLHSDDICRSDPIIIQIYKELGDECNTKYSKIKIKKIPKKYEEYYYISEYDGLECIKINYNEYKLDSIYNKITEILQNTNNNNIKIIEIEEFISTIKSKKV